MCADKVINVLIVEDSAVARQHLKNILSSDSGIRVMEAVRDGEEAVRFVQQKRPDVITMDINMPRMNGLDATRKIMETHPVPIVIVSASYDSSDVGKSFQAMESGAVAILEKPMGEGHPEYAKSASGLIETVKLMSEVKVVKRWPRARAPRLVPAPVPKRPMDRLALVAIGASTGGPPVIQTVLSGLPKDYPAPIAIVQHISRGFLSGLVEWLEKTTELRVRIAEDAEALMPGNVYFAPDDFHFGVANGLKAVLSKAGPVNGVRPSVSYLFSSATEALGSDIVGVLLTGMGKDGAAELKAMKERGAVTIAQDRESSVVHGMPGEAIRLDGANFVLAPEKISAMLESLGRGDYGLQRHGG